MAVLYLGLAARQLVETQKLYYTYRFSLDGVNITVMIEYGFVKSNKTVVYAEVSECTVLARQLVSEALSSEFIPVLSPSHGREGIGNYYVAYMLDLSRGVYRVELSVRARQCQIPVLNITERGIEFHQHCFETSDIAFMIGDLDHCWVVRAHGGRPAVIRVVVEKSPDVDLGEIPLVVSPAWPAGIVDVALEYRYYMR